MSKYDAQNMQHFLSVLADQIVNSLQQLWSTR
jgi:hypothetical protein